MVGDVDHSSLIRSILQQVRCPMPVGAVVVVRLSEMPSDDDLNRWRSYLLTEFGSDDFYYSGPLEIVGDAEYGRIPTADGSVWLDVGLWKCYYGKGYERGDAKYIVRLAEWLERHVPSC